ncbi:MAG: cytochrome c [Gammaproteobacteria bacterium]|nr:cytochrome c [Gammaproteobacteria bacterium]
MKRFWMIMLALLPVTHTRVALAYTEEQAIGGQALYYQHCLQCHGETMAGVDQAPPLAGPQFAGHWRGESLLALVERMNTMPPDKPGTLSRQNLVDILSYVLWYNGLPFDQAPLTTDRTTLTDTKFPMPAMGE